MYNFKNIVFSAASVSMVAACSSTWDVEAVKNSASQGGDFDKALKHEYIDLATEERSEGDWDAVRYFVTKAKTASRGKAPEVESLTRRVLPQDKIETVSLARERLVKAFEKDAKVKAPKYAAKAQAAYEEWTQELEENRQSNHIARAKEKFEKAMDAIERKSSGIAVRQDKNPTKTKLENKTDSSKLKAPKTLITPQDIGDGKYVVYFSFGKTGLKENARKMVVNAAKAFRKRKIKKVLVKGHTDRVGSEKVNLYVSRLRARAVSLVLNKAGIPADNIKIQAFGEYKNAVKTNDEVREPKNRRVEISFEYSQKAS